MRRIVSILLIVATTTFALGAASVAHGADAAAEAYFANQVNLERAKGGLGGLTTHSVLTAKAEAWAQHMADNDCLCHSTLTDGITVKWSKLGENVGIGTTNWSIHKTLAASAPHYANMVDPAFSWIGVGVAYRGGQIYVAEVFMRGDPPPSDSRGRSIAARPQGGFWVLRGDGAVLAYEGAPTYGAPKFPGDYARDITTMPDGNGYVILDSLGGVHLYGSARTNLGGITGPYFGWDIARSIAVTPDGKGYAVLDGWGGVHTYGTARALTNGPYWAGWDIARAIAYRPDGSLYELDGFGTVWSRGGATNYGSPYFGWDIARDLTVWPDGKGYAVEDGFGGVHRFGSAKSPGPTPYQPIDRWRAVVVQSGTFLAVRNDGYAVRF